MLGMRLLESPGKRQDGDAEQAALSPQHLQPSLPNSMDFLPTSASRPGCTTGLVESRWKREPLGDIQGEGLNSGGSRMALPV